MEHIEKAWKTCNNMKNIQRNKNIETPEQNMEKPTKNIEKQTSNIIEQHRKT